MWVGVSTLSNFQPLRSYGLGKTVQCFEDISIMDDSGKASEKEKSIYILDIVQKGEGGGVNGNPKVLR